MHLVTKNNPLTLVFPETMMGRENFEKSVVDTRSKISHEWRDAIGRLKKQGEYADNIFSISEAEIRSTLERFYRDNRNFLADDMILESLNPGTDLNNKQLGVYFMTKALLTPNPMARMRIATDAGSAPYFYINKSLQQRTLNYLYKNHKPVWDVLAGEMGQAYDFITGRSTVFEQVADKSPFYTGRHFIGSESISALTEKPNAILRFGIDPSLGLQLKSRGVVSLKDVEYDGTGVGYREVQSILNKLNKNNNRSVRCE